jgi:hypothetical protein
MIPPFIDPPASSNRLRPQQGNFSKGSRVPILDSGIPLHKFHQLDLWRFETFSLHNMRRTAKCLLDFVSGWAFTFREKFLKLALLSYEFRRFSAWFSSTTRRSSLT